MSDLAWHLEAACKNQPSSLWFPTVGESDVSQAGREICKGCVVRSECLEYALKNCIDHGTWGGLSPRERRQLKRRQQAARRRSRVA